MSEGELGKEELQATAEWFHPLMVSCNGVVGQMLGGHMHTTPAINVRCLCPKRQVHRKDNNENRQDAADIYTIDSWLDHCIPGNEAITEQLTDEKIEQHCWSNVKVHAPNPQDFYHEQHGKTLLELCRHWAEWAGGPALAGQKIWVYWCEQAYDAEVMRAVQCGTAARGSDQPTGIWYLGEVLAYDEETATFIVSYPSDQSFARVLLPLTHVHWGEDKPAEGNPVVIKHPPPHEPVMPVDEDQYRDVLELEQGVVDDDDESDLLLPNTQGHHDPSSAYLLNHPSVHEPSPQLTISGLHEQQQQQQQQQQHATAPMEVDQPSAAPPTAASKQSKSLKEGVQGRMEKEKQGGNKSAATTSRQPAAEGSSSKQKAPQKKAPTAPLAGKAKASKAPGVASGGVKKTVQKTVARDYGDFEDMHDPQPVKAKPGAAATSKQAAAGATNRTANPQPPAATQKGVRAHSPSPQPPSAHEQPGAVNKQQQSHRAKQQSPTAATQPSQSANAVSKEKPSKLKSLAAVYQLTCLPTDGMKDAASSIGKLLLDQWNSSHGVQVRFGCLPDVAQSQAAGPQRTQQPSLTILPNGPRDMRLAVRNAKQLGLLQALSSAFVKQACSQTEGLVRHVQLGADTAQGKAVLDLCASAHDGAMLACVNNEGGGLGLAITANRSHHDFFVTAAAAAGGAQGGATGSGPASLQPHNNVSQLQCTHLAVGPWQLHVIIAPETANTDGGTPAPRGVFLSLTWNKPSSMQSNGQALTAQQQQLCRLCKAVGMCVVQLSQMLSAQLLTAKKEEADKAAAHIIKCFRACKEYVALV